MVENRDSCWKIPMGCEFMSCEWIMRDNPLLWITSLNARVTCYLYLEQQVYVWVERPSEETGCTTVYKI
jgi:hypothetical protein